MRNKVAKIIFGVILLGAIIIPSFGTISTNVGDRGITILSYDSPERSN
ncbi:hypothetical protein [Clostridium folliculivorans]|uniref:Uncharacterized protein n=1 Tax=Clostridium folliculivorans TaxID=2886038 RepID=A0A9W6DBF9_9CLOT|nr:hypothetical protein [Clostridium folliculivorans]GKU26385.1 hypothetical protein CFOLD11_32120 [Clostridium folliculivorans]GKU32060.1 hypothetical protein CFB3_41680 [Clostridium folliculivorans]